MIKYKANFILEEIFPVEANNEYPKLLTLGDLSKILSVIGTMIEANNDQLVIHELRSMIDESYEYLVLCEYENKTKIKNTTI